MAEQTVAQQKPDGSADVPRVHAAALTAFIKRAFEAAGLPGSDADILAGLMVEADLRGSDTHGVIRLPLYLRRLKAGGVNPRPNIRIVQEKPATALVDGDNGMGHLVMRFAAMTAIEKARHAGVGWVGARMSNHAGPAALYAMMPLAHDMIGLYLAVGSNNHLPPWGSTENSARHQSHRHCDSSRGRAADRARHGADGGGLRQSPPQDATGRGDAGRLDDRP